MIVLLLVIITIGCSQNNTQFRTTEVEFEKVTLPTPADNLDSLVKNISADDPAVRLVSIRALNKYGKAATMAIPALKEAVYDPITDVRISAIIILGSFGPDASSAVPDLTDILINETTYTVRVQTARSLGQIGSRSAVPSLAETLFENNVHNATNYDLAIEAAVSIAKITDQKFSGGAPQGGYVLDQKGVPLIVLDAREWWEDTGQYQEWTD